MSQAGGSVPGGPTPDPAGDAGEGSAADSAESADIDQIEDWLASDAGTEPVEGVDGVEDGVVDADVVEAVELARRFEAERDEYLDHLKRLQAEFENFKRRVEAQAAEVRDRAAIDLVRELLPVLDACDAAMSHGNEEIEPIRTQLLQTLQKQGLEAVAEDGVAFDPNIHEAVMHEQGDGQSVVAEVLRPGYLWRDNVVRAAMVKVRG